MRRMLTLLLPLGMLAMACAEGGPTGLSGGDGSGAGNSSGNTGSTGSGSTASGVPTPETTVLDEREVNYSEAYRTASLKLVRALPTLADVKAIANATDKKK